MRKKIKSVLASTLAGLIISGLFACSKNADIKAMNFTGIWVKSSAGEIQRYQFKSDSTFIFVDLAADTGNSKILGYRYKSTGKYHLVNSELSFYDVKLFLSNNNGYSAENELVETPVSTPSTIYKIKIDGKKLSLSFDCPVNASCVASPLVFARQ